jgi:hypothetical protein
MSYLFGLLHSFVIQRQSGSDHSCFVVFTPLTFDNGFVGQALPLAIRWIGRRRACPTVLLTDNDNAALRAISVSFFLLAPCSPKDESDSPIYNRGNSRPVRFM